MTTTMLERITALNETIEFQRGVMKEIAAYATSGRSTMNPKGSYIGQLEEATRRLEAHAKALPEADEYQGWSNRETWCVNLWINNEATHYEACRSNVLKSRKELGDKWRYQAANRLSDYVECLIETQRTKLQRAGGDLMAIDMVNACFARVNWIEIAEGFEE